MIRLKAGDCKDQYVAFLDVLGFGALIRGDYSGALDFYDQFSKAVSMGTAVGVASVRVISDSVIVVGTELAHVVHTVNLLCFGALSADCLIRGGIAFGRHGEAWEDGNLLVVSEPLVRAVEVERTIRHPCVALHSSVTVPLEAWRFKASSFERPLLFFEGRWIVNPFSLMWGTSAAHRVQMMKEQHPEHSEKYEWFLRLYEAVKTGAVVWPQSNEDPTSK